eukprot:jgi/Chrzof1/10342/Cz04g38160.t1
MAYYSEGNFLKRFLSDTLGFRGGKNLASWGVAGALAYFYIYLPEQKKAQDIKAARDLARQEAIEKGTLEVQKARVMATDPQRDGLIKGSTKQQSDQL